MALGIFLCISDWHHRNFLFTVFFQSCIDLRYIDMRYVFLRCVSAMCSCTICLLMPDGIIAGLPGKEPMAMNYLLYLAIYLILSDIVTCRPNGIRSESCMTVKSVSQSIMHYFSNKELQAYNEILACHICHMHCQLNNIQISLVNYLNSHF